jgi:hypothetical protein
MHDASGRAKHCGPYHRNIHELCALCGLIGKSTQHSLFTFDTLCRDNSSSFLHTSTTCRRCLSFIVCFDFLSPFATAQARLSRRGQPWCPFLCLSTSRRGESPFFLLHLHVADSFVLRLSTLCPHFWLSALYPVELCSQAITMDSEVDSVFGDPQQDESDDYSPVVRMLRMFQTPG